LKAQQQLEAGTIVRYTDPFPRIVNGPDDQCDVPNTFRKVRDEASGIEGWVLENDVQLIAPGASCPP